MTKLFSLISMIAVSIAGCVSTPLEGLLPGQRTNEVTLELGKSLEREICKGETHIYEVVAPSNHVIRGVVEQRGVDVVVRIKDPHGAMIATIDSPNGTNGPEPWSFEAEAAGTWHIEVSPLPETDQPGHYEARIEEIITSYENAERAAKRHYQSARMLKLWKEFRSEGPLAIERFAKEMEGHAPLVEPLEGDPQGDVLITFVRRVPSKKYAQVVGGPARPAVRLLRFQETDIMYLTLRCPRDARFGYGFIVRGESEFEAGTSSFEADPWNPHDFAMSSLLELPAAPAQDWAQKIPSVSAGRLVEGTIHSEILGEERKVCIYLPAAFEPTHGPHPYVVVLDGEAYGHWAKPLIPTPIILDNLIAQGKIAPMLAVLVDSGKTRDVDLAMSARFSDFLAKELAPWVRREYGAAVDPAKVTLSGSSLGGLCAAYSAFRHPDVFGNVLSQSGSFWFSPGALENTRGFGFDTGALISEIVASPPRALHFWMEVGIFEGGDQLTENRRMRDVLLAKGYGVDYHEFSGGHDYACWRGTLADGLRALAGGGASIARESH